MARFKIEQRIEAGLCSSCEHGTAIERNRRVIVFCRMIHARFSGGVDKCSAFHHADLPDRYDMEKIAWEVRTDKSGKVIGFERPVKE